MSTNARIGLRLELDNGVESIYTHWDGYPSHHGPILLGHWTTREQVQSLLALGDLSVLGREVGEKHDFDRHLRLMEELPIDWCLSYGRDRGEEDVGAKSHGLDDWPDYGQEYEYLFTPAARSVLAVNEGWAYRKCRYTQDAEGNYIRHWDEWIPLTVEACVEPVEGASV